MPASNDSHLVPSGKRGSGSEESRCLIADYGSPIKRLHDAPEVRQMISGLPTQTRRWGEAGRVGS